ncbi:NAD-dependent epimerase/dehydratase family protein [Pseudoalteromonas xiamenensis]|uniref:NAD-dependent epimerase/dehydratase family protein n=1 Tax=Pseudoalteromonas xiamenensis TaxID=882626 RepID=UPI0027E42C75|nr:NAD-dependent epimerase/dehydratase family protein [Pseudoalteromonas xiamenensis]WMN60234.1 NAD-dependent epimerase/dehydratase family protein [Pseudoalteromonas xiamenensis]
MMANILNDKPILVTGAAGFIGFHLAKALLDKGCTVVGLDNLNAYYSPELKDARLSLLSEYPNFTFKKIELNSLSELQALFDTYKFDVVVHLAAQAGVRYSIDAPMTYCDSNLVGMMHILECCRHNAIKHLLFASSSSVYGLSDTMPLTETAKTDSPVSLYAATKKANEAMAYSYAKLYGLPMTGLRFFTVYGPWGRPDMALFKFVEKMRNHQSIDVYNMGQMRRDFTYIDDVINAIVSMIPNVPDQKVPYEIFNIGSNNPKQLLDFIEEIERALGVKADKNLLPMQAGDVLDTWADVQKLKKHGHPLPNTPFADGIKAFVDWHLAYYAT